MRSSDAQRETWKRLLAEQQMSGSSVSHWCREHEVDKVKFYYWRKRLESGADAVVAEVAESVSPQWLAVDCFDMPRSGDPPVESASWLTLRVGRVAVQITAGFDPRLLSDVLCVLETRG